MKCIFCHKKTEKFFQSYHTECLRIYSNQFESLCDICKLYDNENISHKDAIFKLKTQLSNSKLYVDFLINREMTMLENIVNKKDTIFYVANGLKISESKNRCIMKNVGWYENRPDWSVTEEIISNNSTIILTDNALYISLVTSHMYFPYNKLVNVGKDYDYIFFDVKTSSPFPHRYKLKTNSKNEKSKLTDTYLFLSCLSDK